MSAASSLEGRRPLFQEARHSLHLRERHEQARARVAQDRHLPRGVFLDPVGAERRIERSGDAARHQRADEDGKEGALGPEHEGDAVAASQAARRQAARHRARLVPQPGVGQRGFAAVVLAQVDVDAVGGPLDMPGERLDDRARMYRRAVRRGCGDGRLDGRRASRFRPRGAHLGGRRPRGGGRGCRRGDRRRQVGRRLRLHHGVVAQADAETPFQADQQLDPFEAADPEVGLEGVAALDIDGAAVRAAAQLTRQLRNDVEDAFLYACAGVHVRQGSTRRMVLMMTGSRGTSSMRSTRVVRTREISSTTSIPSTIRPKTA